MVNEKILEFYEEFRDEVLGYVKENGPISINTAFKALFLSYLTEAGETLVSDCTLVDFKKDGENMKLDGYAFSEYFHSLTLLVSKYQAKPQPEKVKKTEIDRLLKKALKFYKTCGTDSFEALEESSDGYQAYEFIKGHKEDIETGAKAAAAGGFTTVMCMANTKPVIDNVETLKYVLDKGKTTPINVYSAAAVSKGFKGEELTDFKSLKEAGAYVFTDDGIPLKDELLVKKAMEEAKKLDMPLSFHEENPAFIEQQGINKGVVSDKLGLGGAPALSEYIMVARDCMLALETGATICIQHISSEVSVELVRTAKRLGADVHAEATPQHFSLTEDIVLEKGTLARVNPPIRTEKDRQAIITALADGTIDIIATDHAPHSREEKDKEFKAAPSGMTGLETSLALGVTKLVKTGRLTMKELLCKMTINPAKLYKMDKGYIKEGTAADIVIYAPDEKWIVGESFASKASNTPFIGQELYGKIKYTICNGNVVYCDC